MDMDNRALGNKACVIIAAKGTAQAVEQMNRTASLGIKLVELRMDLIYGGDELDFGLAVEGHIMVIVADVVGNDMCVGIDASDEPELLFDAFLGLPPDAY